MNKKIISALLIIICLISLFASCKKQDLPPASETASQSSDGDAYTVGQGFEYMDEQESIADSTKTVSSADAFVRAINDPERKTVAYYGAEDIIFDFDDYTDKTVSVKTVGTVSLNSSVYSLVLEEAKGIEINAKADSLIISGNDITADIKADTGDIYIKGKNTVLNVYSGTVQNILIKNSTAVIVNHTEGDITVMLANGTKVNIASYHTYFVETNEIKENAVA